jgi:hypothetical protein
MRSVLVGVDEAAGRKTQAPPVRSDQSNDKGMYVPCSLVLNQISISMQPWKAMH